MVENVTVTPGDVRGGGNIVSEGKEVKDYIGKYGVITEGTDTVANISETIYTMKKIFMDSKWREDENRRPTRIIISDPWAGELNPWFLGNIQLHVTVQSQYYTKWDNIHYDATIYCEYDGKIISSNTGDDGTAYFLIDVDKEAEGEEDVCRFYNLRFYFLGHKEEYDDESLNWEHGPSFRKITLLTCHSSDRGITFFDRNPVIQSGNIHRIPILASCGGLGVPGQMVKFYEQYIEYIIQVFSNPHIIQTDEIATISARFSDEDGSAIPGKLVKFYEEYIESLIKVYSTPRVIKTNEVAQVYGRVSDEDGSGIPNKKVRFFEEYGDIEIVVSTDNPIIQTGETSAVFARASDGSGVIVGNVIQFFEEYDLSEITVFSDTHIIQTDETATISAKVGDEDGSAVPDIQVDFYEYYDLSKVSVYADKKIIQTNDEVTISARVSDEDGSVISGEIVYFYEEYEITNITVGSNPNPLQTTENAVISARVRDNDGSLVSDERVDFTEDYEDDYNIALNVNKELVQTGETATATVTVKNGDTPVEDVYIRFYDNNE